MGGRNISGEYCVDCTDGEVWLFGELKLSELGFGDMSGEYCVDCTDGEVCEGKTGLCDECE